MLEAKVKTLSRTVREIIFENQEVAKKASQRKYLQFATGMSLETVLFFSILLINLF